jgi:acetyl-CoA acetyltransferase
MGEVFIIGATVALGGGSSPSKAVDLARTAASGALTAAEVESAQVAGVFVGCLPGVTNARKRRQPRPALDALKNEIGGEACMHRVYPSSAEALHLGWQAVEMGVYDVVMCIGLDDEAGGSWPDTRTLRPYAASAQRYMSASGATVEHLARVAAKNHRHGALNPQAPAPEGLGTDAVLESEMVAWPLRRLMVAPHDVGAAAVVLASAEGRRHIRGPAARILTCTLAEEGGSLNGASAGRAARLAYQAAGVGPDDVDCAELHDLTAAAELAAYESLQFVPEGQGPELIDSGFTALGGVLPVNTSGGRLALGDGQAVGIAQLCEVAAQVCGTAGARQVAGARVGLVHSRGGSEHSGGPVTLTILSSE